MLETLFQWTKHMPKLAAVLRRATGKPRPLDEGPANETVDLSLRLLEQLATLREPIGVSELAREFAASKATVYRHLRTLMLHGFVRQEATTMRYAAGNQAVHSRRAPKGAL